MAPAWSSSYALGAPRPMTVRTGCAGWRLGHHRARTVDPIDPHARVLESDRKPWRFVEIRRRNAKTLHEVVGFDFTQGAGSRRVVGGVQERVHTPPVPIGLRS